MQPAILKQNLGTEFYTDELCYITELSNSAGDPAVSIARARVEPGVTTRWHRLDETAERYVMLSGEGLVEVADLPPTKVLPGDVVLIPPFARQRITNTGKEQLIFLAICSPRFQPEVYEDIEDAQ
ncbi:cupin domain-containing protein [Haliea sp. E17]|uniref:cupin domain-containing protein n=1 Tax=Haliea sp. E17 TaxID=3401576 RepID=UPI003AB08307